VTATATLTQVTGLGPNFQIANPEDKLIVKPGDGQTTVTINTKYQGGTLRVDGGNSNDIYNVQAVSAPTTINTSPGNNVFNVGSNAPAGNGTLGNIKAALTLNGSGGTDSATIDDSGDGTGQTGALSSTQVTGVGMGAAITYSNLSALHINLGS